MAQAGSQRRGCSLSACGQAARWVAMLSHHTPLAAPSRGPAGQEGLRGRVGGWVGGSYQEAVVLGVGGQAQAETHVVFPLGHVG